MKKGFEHFYRPSKDEFSELWKTCMFVFDTNVLLDLYRYTPETRDELLSILEKLKSRIWLPHQVASEFHPKRLDVVAQSFAPYQKLTAILAKMENDGLASLTQLQLPTKHPFLNVEELRNEIKEAISQLADKLKRQPPDIPLKANAPTKMKC